MGGGSLSRQMMHAPPSDTPAAAAVGVGRDAVAAERVSVLVLVGALGVSELDTVPARRALHCFLWPPSFQCTFWHSAEQYRTCGSRARWRVKFRRDSLATCVLWSMQSELGGGGGGATCCCRETRMQHDLMNTPPKRSGQCTFKCVERVS